MASIRESIDGYINKIDNAVLGRDVRDSIVNALDVIARTFDSQLNAYGIAVTRAEAAQTLNEDRINRLNQLEADSEGVSNTINTFQTFANNLTTPSVLLADYSNPAAGVWSPGTPNVTYDAVSNRFEFTLPKAPVFPQNPTVIFGESGGSESRVTFDPRSGTLQFMFPNLIAKFFNESTLNLVNVAPNENNIYPEQPSMSYNSDTGVTTIKVLQGLNGTGAAEAFGALAKRPFIMRDLYVADPSSFLVNASAPNYFPQQSRVDREHTVDQESGRIIFNGANDFDAAIIVFRKSVDNNSGVQLNNNFSWNKTKAKDITNQKNAAFLANNIDYNSTVSVFIRKPAYNPNNSSSERMTTATACFIDAAGRRFTRRVHWTAVDCHLVCQGGATKTWPLIRIIPDVDNNADAQTGVGTYGTRVGDAFTGAFIFENAKQDGAGDGPEWSWHALNTYRQTLLSKSDKNPQQMINLNKVYNQVLIPERIIGISFGASSELVDLYTGPRYTDAQG